MIYAKNEDDKPVDWWFIYKMPKHSGNPENQGYQYLYYDPIIKQLALSHHTLNQKTGALYNTLNCAFNSNDKSQSFIIYNDEFTSNGKKKEAEYKGHTKGILVFNHIKNEAMIILHSTPRFPENCTGLLPNNEKVYGQTFLCITLDDYKTIRHIADIMLRQQNPNIIQNVSYLSPSINSNDPLHQLFYQKQVDESIHPESFTFKSKENKTFKMIAKSKKWGKDFWIDLLAPYLGVDLNVETWRRGAVPPSQDRKTSKDEIKDTTNISLDQLGYPQYHWPYTMDHSKWGTVSKKDVQKKPWVCIADINRMKSQEKRGGGAICFIDNELWNALNSLETNTQHQASMS